MPLYSPSPVIDFLGRVKQRVFDLENKSSVDMDSLLEIGGLYAACGDIYVSNVLHQE